MTTFTATAWYAGAGTSGASPGSMTDLIHRMR